MSNGTIMSEHVPTVDEVMDDCYIGNGLYEWAYNGGSSRFTYEELRPALEDAYDPSMANWVGMVQLELD